MSEKNNHENSLTHLTPAERYQQDLEMGLLTADPGQALAIRHIDRLYHDLTSAPDRPKGLLRSFLRIGRQQNPYIRGVYLWGRVGRGKTYIVDTFFERLPFDAKRRIHFHSFMRQIHGELGQLKQTTEPLAIIASRWAQDIRLLCLDEFHVGDITDAMILGNLLEALFENGVCLVATSNEAPANLYRDGLQRDRFLPAIAMLESHLDIVELFGDVDYRLRALEQAEVYYVPHTADVDDLLRQRFIAIAPEPGIEGAGLEIDGREIPTRRRADGVVWFDFETLCVGPRATSDYIEIALCHHTVFVSDIPILDRHANDAARRFVHLIDEFYDRNVNVVISAASSPETLYTGTRLAAAFKRTASRLQEMQSHDYLAQPHLCD